MKVFICDDSAFIRELLRLAIEDLGHQVVGEASDGEEAIKKIINLKPELVIMDLVLPSKNGIDVAKEVFQILPKMKFVACTSLEQDVMGSETLRSGFLAYLTKPFSRAEIKNLFQFFTSHRKEVSNGRI